jgi:predicted KAP-like P-loop ATPase
MWSDIETDKDLLGFSVHANLIKDVVTNVKNLPITIGLYGDWGSGKSSVLKILEKELEEDENSIVIYFDGWTFESFDDAKLALIQGIVDELEKSEKFKEKVKDKAEDIVKAFSKLKKSINWMRILKVTAKSAIPVLSASMTGGLSVIPMLISAFQEHKNDLADILTGDKAEDFLKDIIGSDKEDKKYAAVREFRNDFSDLIEKSKYEKVIILIDDLDRCLPRHIIENQEAIKLFLNVPGTAFVIAADEYIVSNAIKSEYLSLIKASEQDRGGHNIGEAYMEKFIQLPYRLPSLSNKEVETFVNLLFCQSELSQDTFDVVQKDFIEFTKTSKFEIYSWDRINAILSGGCYGNLQTTIGFMSRFSNIISVALRRNPRLIKRFLNAYEVRNTLLKASGIDSQDNRFALLKLMLLEYKHEKLFNELCEWVFNQPTTPSELILMEKAIAGEKTGKYPENNEWEQTDVKTLLGINPLFSSVNLKELFWVSRDKLSDIIGGTSLYSAKVKDVFKRAYNHNSDSILKKICVDEIAQLSADDSHDFFEQLDEMIITKPNEKNGYNVYFFCIENNIEGAYAKFVGILDRIDVQKIPFSLGNKFSDIMKMHPDKKIMEIISSNKKLSNAINTAK